ncbi:hypothetical protein [Chromobacterium paludis]|uniref:Uncharacterized protein n=1 Tax=Chromobacterium paludis TaxID=2605945 RepID=A0A5C1DID4_9NEIS|nr:hypothetical protein [Chromobacterium paludis]QEL55438.1 hypothetical protein FYK34_07595 [Chromobacterium paludis]
MKTLVIFSIMLLLSFSAFAEENRTPSPDKKETLIYNCRETSCSAWIETGGEKHFFFQDVPTNTVSAKWLTTSLAQVSFSCGSPCSVSFFYTKGKGVSKDIHDVLAINPKRSCVLIPIDDGIATYSIFGKIQDPSLWHAKYNDKRFNFYTQSAVIFSTIHAKFDQDGTLRLNFTKKNGEEAQHKVIKACGEK